MNNMGSILKKRNHVHLKHLIMKIKSLIPLKLLVFIKNKYKMYQALSQKIIMALTILMMIKTTMKYTKRKWDR